jgi:RHS repeat-associated protein
MSASAATTAAGKGIPGCVLSVSDPSDFCMEWNAEDQLKRVLKNGVEQARFSYDPYGRRVEKVAGGVTTSYLYDGEDILREIRGTATFTYVHGPGVDEPLAREEGTGTLSYYHADGLGSVAKRTSQAGALVHEYRYDAWGSIEVGASEPGYAFTSREWDPETGLAYYRARYYDPRAGRFLSLDSASESTALNPYAYVNGDPVNNLDPTGHYSVRTDSREFNAAIDAGVDAIVSDVMGTCPCQAWFIDHGSDLLPFLSVGTPPSVQYMKGVSWSYVSDTAAPWDDLRVNYDRAMKEDKCFIAGAILHELGHIVLQRNDHVGFEEFRKACSAGCVTVPRGHDEPS